METITNAANAASKAVFGDSANKEPVSGAQGDTAKGEPYDAGNLDADSQEKLEKRLSDDNGRPKPDASEVQDSTRTEPVGPGPKPVETVARQHGGDTGATDKPAQVTEETKVEKKDESSSAKPAGQEVIHASGFAAEGGDFDASNPGAGKEADRLVEEKHKDPNGENKPAVTAGAASSSTDAAKKTDNADSSKAKDSKNGKDKPSLSQRIKAKLHRSK